MSTLSELVRAGRVERVAADLSAAGIGWTRACSTSRSAAALVDSDPAMAYAAL